MRCPGPMPLWPVRSRCDCGGGGLIAESAPASEPATGNEAHSGWPGRSLEDSHLRVPKSRRQWELLAGTRPLSASGIRL